MEGIDQARPLNLSHRCSLYVYRSKPGNQTALKHRIKDICETRVRFKDQTNTRQRKRDIDGLCSRLARPAAGSACSRVVGNHSRFSPAVLHGSVIEVEMWFKHWSDFARSLVTAKVSAPMRPRSSYHAIWICGRISGGAILDFSRPAKPTDNSFIESFNGKLHAERFEHALVHEP